MGFSSIKNIVDKVLADKNINYKTASRCDRMLNVLRKYIKNVDKISLTKNVLYVELESAVYMNEINIRKKEIICEINQYNLDRDDDVVVDDIKILIKGRRC